MLTPAFHMARCMCYITHTYYMPTEKNAYRRVDIKGTPIYRPNKARVPSNFGIYQAAAIIANGAAQ